ALLISLLTLSEYLFSWNLGVDEFFVRDLDSPADLFPGRMAPIAVLSSGFSSVALLMLGTRISQYFSVGVIVLSLSALMNYLFDLQVVNRGSEYSYVPAHTGLTFLMISLAIIIARPTRGTMQMLTSDLPGSRALRLLLPGIIILTILMAWLAEWLESLGVLDTRKESIFLVILLIFVYSTLIYFTARDVNRAEEKLLLSDQILERVNALVLVADSQGFISYVSSSVKTILGFEPSELLGDGWWKISRSNLAEGQAEKKDIRSSASHEIQISTVPYEREVQDRWGNNHWIIWVDALGPNSSVIGVGHDITERKRAEQKLMENEKRYRQAITAANAIPYSLDYATNQYLFIGNG
ncbi:MAG: PAS domain S-box protein, partial [Anaerolineae bacterium]|nr:PAS domain S-box protein [Anaerolineae bacterium]